MRYDAEKGLIYISCRELTKIARRGISAAPPLDEDDPRHYADGSGELYEYPFTAGDYSFVLTVPAATVAGGEVHLTAPTERRAEKPTREERRQARGEAFISALVLSEREEKDSVSISVTYESKITRQRHTEEETVSRGKLKSFFERCKMSIIVYAEPEIERVTVRLPSMKKMRFPFKNMRDGQREIINSVYRSIAMGARLFTAAPTGTGKTVSMLYPALRALGDGRCSKVFYFTPKTTTANAARDCILRLCDAEGSGSGAIIRAIIMPSKERACKRGNLCRISRDRCPHAACEKLSDAVMALYALAVPVVSLAELTEISEEFSVCPHELALTYAELCDAVILDINYLFDPSVYIRRFFSECGDYAFLIDEAHNLPDRAREMYSAEISEEFIVTPALSDLFGEHSTLKNATRGIASEFHDALAPYIKEELYRDAEGNPIGAVHLSEVPYELYSVFDKLIRECECELLSSFSATDEQAAERTHELRGYLHTVRKFRDAMEYFDNRYEFFIFAEGDAYRAKCFCIDPSRRISERLDMGRGAVFFSGTLSPLHYYRATLGDDRSAVTLEVDSPFDPSQLSVSIMNKISTRLSERDDTLGAVCRVIAATLSAKRGNYMIFSPSFTYSAALARVFRAKYPKIRVLEQTPDMTAKEKREFIEAFEAESDSYLVGFCVMGGIYSEGIDLAGDSLIGAVVVGIGIPQLSYEREAIAAYYQDKYEEGKQFAYVYPGVNRVLQAAGRVIRREDDKGVVVLIDDRFDDPIYKTVIPKLWSDMRFIADPKELRATLDEFWRES